MGKKLNALFGKSKPFKKSKFKTIVSLAVSRIAILKKHHHIRWSQARSDVVQLLTLNHQESALLRIDHVIREQNILDAFGIIDGYCRLLIDRIMLIENSKACPDELKEAISSLIFAASRYGQLPELQKIYRIFMAKYGKNFSNHAIELRNNCGVNPKIAKTFPTRWPSWGTKLKVLNEIASENGIILLVDGESSGISKGKLDTRESNGLNDHKLKNVTKNSPEGIQEDKNFSRFMKERSKYRDVKTAAEAAFELAAQAAAAARAVVELSQSKLHEKDSANHISSGFQQLKLSYPVGSSESELQNSKVTASDFKDWTKGLHSGKIDCFDTNSEPIEDGMVSHKFSSYSKEAGSKYVNEQTKNVLAASSTDSEEIGIYNPLKTGGDFYGNMDEKGKRQGKLPWLELNDENKNGSLVHKAPATAHDWNAHKKFSFLRDEFLKNRHPNVAKDENNSDENRDELNNKSPMDGQYSNRGRRPVSIRTRRTRWH